MEDVLKLLAAGADVTPFTFPAGLLGAGAGPGLAATNLDLALALQVGSFPSFLMGSLGSGAGAPLPLPQALALPSLELPKLLSLDVGLDGGPGPSARSAAAADNGNNSDPGGSGGSLLPRNGRILGARQPQQAQQLELPPLRQPIAPKRDLEQPVMPGRNKRQGGAPEPRLDGFNSDSRQPGLSPTSAAAERFEARRAEARQQQAADGSNSDGSETSSESAGAAAPRSAPARGARRGAGNKDPVARAQMRQLKKRDLNREAQRRFRDRQKAALALLESTTQSQQREIEALRLTNKLLEEQYRVLMEQYKALQLRLVTIQMKAKA